MLHTTAPFFILSKLSRVITFLFPKQKKLNSHTLAHLCKRTVKYFIVTEKTYTNTPSQYRLVLTEPLN